MAAPAQYVSYLLIDRESEGMFGRVKLYTIPQVYKSRQRGDSTIITHCARSIWLNERLLVTIRLLSQAPHGTRRPNHDTDLRGFVHLCLCHR